VIPKRPINADVPAPEEQEGGAKEAKPKRREPKPLTPKLLAGLVVLALVFIVVAIVAGGGGGEADVDSGAPSVVTGSQTVDPSSDSEALAFPSLATNNTTRIGGSDAATAAAAVALAVFPSTTPAQRPAAVALVDEDDPDMAIAAAVLTAPPIRAPILYADGKELPEISADALAALGPAGSKDTGGVSFFSVGQAGRDDLPDGGRVQILLGARPTFYEKAAEIARARERIAGPPDHVVVVALNSPEYAAPAAAWAARSGDPVLFVEPNRLPPETAQALSRNPKTPVYVLGPSSVVSAKVVQEIGRISKQVKRVAGEDPVANAIALARYRDGSFGWNINDPGHGFVLARSDSPAFAAAAAPLSGSGTWGPLLLTDDADTLPEALRSYLLDVKPGYTDDPTRAFYNHVWVIGDESAIGVEEQAKVNELAELAKIGGGE
jgi:hypothetical protein